MRDKLYPFLTVIASALIMTFALGYLNDRTNEVSAAQCQQAQIQYDAIRDISLLAPNHPIRRDLNKLLPETRRSMISICK